MSTPLKILLSITVVVGITVTISAVVLVYMIANSPETYVYTGPQMNKSHTKIIHEMGLLDDAEEIQYFYSDALMDIRNKMYFVTDKRLVLYDDDWVEPLLAVPFEAIVDAEVEYNESFFIDSNISITLDNGEVWTFPVSSERGRDKDFFNYIEERMGGPAEPSDSSEPETAVEPGSASSPQTEQSSVSAASPQAG